MDRDMAAARIDNSADPITMKSTFAPQCVAKHPFDTQSADVVFRTADGVDFYVYKLVLSLASPFFADMFSLSETDGTNQNLIKDPILVPECSKTFDYLLRLCFPVEEPVLRDLSCVVLVLDAAIKYQLNKPTAIARALLKNFTDSDPSRVFAAACRLGLEEEARAAAMAGIVVEPQSHQDIKKKGRAWRCSKITHCHCAHRLVKPASYTVEMADICAGAYYRLLRYHRTKQLPRSFTQNCDPSPSPSCYKDMYEEIGDLSRLEHADADIIFRSLDGLEFPSHRLLFRLASGKALLESCEQEPNTTESQGLPILRVPITSAVLRDLLRMCYPSAHYELDNPQRLLALSQVAIKYDMTHLLRTLRTQTSRLMPARPLAACLIAMQNGWKEEAESAARALAEKRDINEYDPILEEIPAALYHSLLEYHSRAISVIEGLLKEHSPMTVNGGWECNEIYRQQMATRSPSIPLSIVAERRSGSLTDLSIAGKKLDDAITSALLEVSIFSVEPKNGDLRPPL